MRLSEQDLVDVGETSDTQAVKQPRSTDDPKPDDRKPDLTMMEQQQTLLRRLLQWTVC